MLAIIGLIASVVVLLLSVIVVGGAPLAASVVGGAHRCLQRSTAIFVPVVVIGVAWAVDSAHSRVWTPYSATAFDAALGRQVIVVGCTADWCLSTGILITALEAKTADSHINECGVRAFRVDLTDNDPEAMAFLTRLGRTTIPLCAIFNRRGEVTFLTDSFTPSDVGRAIDDALAGPGPSRAWR